LVERLPEGVRFRIQVCEKVIKAMAANRRTSAWIDSLLSGFLALMAFFASSVTYGGPVYVRPSGQLSMGQSFGNRNAYVTLNRTTDLMGDSSTGPTGNGFRESTDQRYYLLQWRLEITSASGERAAPIDTTFYPAHQQTLYRLAAGRVSKSFFLPFETGYPRAGHYLLERGAGDLGIVRVRSTVLLPHGAAVQPSSVKGWNYVQIRYPEGGAAVLWAAASAQVYSSETPAGIEVVADYEWVKGQKFALSFVYSTSSQGIFGGEFAEFALSTTFDVPSLSNYLLRIRSLLTESEEAMRRYLETARLVTPDRLINRSNLWAKINQLRLQQQYRWGEGFTNMPPSDIVVARDTAWYLMGSSYFSQAWSRKLLDFWFAHGLELSGKFSEYLTASRLPLFSDDYGLNINDNTPLMVIASSHFYSVTADRGFLNDVYPALIRAADWIESQRNVGTKNDDGLVWCTSTERGVRGLCTWRNVIEDYNLSGAVTEVNSEAYAALRSVAELAGVMGDVANKRRFTASAQSLRNAINRHLHSNADARTPYYLNIAPSGTAVAQDTADQLFPVLFGVSDAAESGSIISNLFSDRFYVVGNDGRGGFRTLSSKEKEYQPEGYSVLGGVWPNIGLWIARAAAYQQRPDLALKALRATAQLMEVPDSAGAHLVPGEIPECLEGDSLRQIGELSSPFVYGILVWSGLESFLGLRPRPQGLGVFPEFPENWNWVAASNIPYRGVPLTLLAARAEKTLYTTARVKTSWRTVIAPAELQSQFRYEPEDDALAFVLPDGSRGLRIVAASAVYTEMRVIERRSGEIVAHFRVSPSKLVHVSIPRLRDSSTAQLRMH
jgi:hypothetical protein